MPPGTTSSSRHMPAHAGARGARQGFPGITALHHIEYPLHRNSLHYFPKAGYVTFSMTPGRHLAAVYDTVPWRGMLLWCYRQVMYSLWLWIDHPLNRGLKHRKCASLRLWEVTRRRFRRLGLERTGEWATIQNALLFGQPGLGTGELVEFLRVFDGHYQPIKPIKLRTHAHESLGHIVGEMPGSCGVVFDHEGPFASRFVRACGHFAGIGQ